MILLLLLLLSLINSLMILNFKSLSMVKSLNNDFIIIGIIGVRNG